MTTNKHISRKGQVRVAVFNLSFGADIINLYEIKNNLTGVLIE